jgi:hypothetical protein
VSREDATTGVVLGAINERCRDLAEARFYLPLGSGALEDVVRAFEFEVSRMGLRYTGFTLADESEEGTFEELGYARSDRDYFWTHYHMEKTLEEGLED